ncbi:MAG: hypothetical protein ACTHKS_11380, partial [Gaiellaceae bacterium]
MPVSVGTAHIVEHAFHECQGGRVEANQPTLHPGADDVARAPPDTGFMTTTDYLISAALILVVVRQVRGKRL